MEPARIEEMRDQIQELRERMPGLELVVLLFGSTVKGRRRARSDVDVAVRCAGPADLDVLRAVLAPALATDRLDLVDLRRVGPTLAMEVARSGRLLFESPQGAFREFQSLASRRYCDTAKLRRAQRRAIHVFLARHNLSLCEPIRRGVAVSGGPAMSPIHVAVIRRKLGHIMTSLDLLGPMREISLQESRLRVLERKGVERVLQEAAEAALDVNAHLIAELGHDVPDDYFGGFVKLGQPAVLLEELAAALAASAGPRNRLVHEDDVLDDAKVLTGVGTILDLYPRYIQAIEAQLVRLED